ncbi:class A beta-lactamase [Sphingomonas sp.]|uniref:class A beta-lactamase n=1 Tax=Sphingomonas sp. TaxID=28214 RepID=UPI0025E8E6E4|nr:class A beta-lactamase [Sphingomonas sp.]
MNDPRPTRRAVLAAAAGLAVANAPAADTELQSLERREALQIGVFAQRLGGRTIWSHRADQRFLMCSTFKIFLVAAVLREADRVPGLLARDVPLVPAKLLANSPVTGRQPLPASLSVEQLCAAAIEYSDNSAANCLLDIVGGPPSVTRMFRLLGDPVSRLDRIEPDLNTGAVGDTRDTTTPRAIAGALSRLIEGSVLGEAARRRLLGWMANEHNGVRRIRAGMPAGWQVADKPGTNNSGSVNDIAILQSPSGQRFLLAIYVRSPVADVARLERIIAGLAASFAQRAIPLA